MRQFRRGLGLVAVIALATLLSTAVSLGLSAGRASASSPVVLVSTDGVTYLPDLAVGLFSDAGLLVPGDTASAELFIKNPTTEPATVRVNVGDVTTDSVELSNNLRLTVVNTSNGSTMNATWTQLRSCDVLVHPVTIPGGAILHIHFALAMLNAPARMAQAQSGAILADVSMRDAAAGSFPVSTCDPATDPGTTDPGNTEPTGTAPAKILGSTGETFPTQLLLLGGLLVGTGWFLVAARRRRKKSEAQR